MFECYEKIKSLLAAVDRNSVLSFKTGQSGQGQTHHRHTTQRDHTHTAHRHTIHTHTIVLSVFGRHTCTAEQVARLQKVLTLNEEASVLIFVVNTGDEVMRENVEKQHFCDLNRQCDFFLMCLIFFYKKSIPSQWYW